MGLNSKELKASPLEKKVSKPKDVIYDPQGQWKYPGQVTRIPGGDITMQDVNYPVLGVDSQGNQQMMYPGQDYKFPGNYVTEYPQLAKGGLVKGKPRYTDKNIQKSINEFLMKRNELLFGPRGKHYYKPNMKKKKDGGTPEAFPQQPTQAEFFARGFVPQGPVGFYKQGGNITLPPAFPQQVPTNYFFAGVPWQPPQMMGGGEPCYECGGQHMADGGWIQDATKGMRKDKPCTGAKFGGPDCPPGSPRYNLAKTFRAMAKKQFGGDADSDEQGGASDYDQDDYLANYSRTFMDKIKNNTMMSIADEASNTVDQAQQQFFAQYGGGMGMMDYGYNPNMMNQQMFANKANYMQNQGQQAIDNFYDTSMGMMATANPYMQGDMSMRDSQGRLMKAQVGGSGQGASENLNNSISYNKILAQQKKAEARKIQSYGDNILAEQNQRRQDEAMNQRMAMYDREEQAWLNQKNNTDLEPIVTGTNPVRNSGSGQGSTQSANQVQSNAGIVTPSNVTTTSTTNTPAATTSYNDPNAQQQWSYPQQGQGMGQGMNYFPMNQNPYMKWKTKDYPMPGFGYNPNNTYLQNYEYRGRMFGQGPRKVSMTFRTYTDPQTGQTTQIPVEEGQGQFGPTSEQNTGPFSQPPFTQDDSNYLTPEERQRRDKTRKGTTLANRFSNFKQNMQERRSDVYVPRADQSPYLRPIQEQDFDTFNFDPSTYKETNKRPLKFGGHYKTQYGGDGQNQNQNYYDTTIVGKYKHGYDPEAVANWSMAGIAGATSLLNQGEANKTDEEMQRMTLADNSFMAMPANRIQNQGRYNWTGMSNGMMDPNSMGVIQQPGIGSYQEGGSYELDQDEIDYIMKNGGSITYL